MASESACTSSQISAALLTWRQYRCCPAVYMLVVAGGGYLQQSRHPGDGEPVPRGSGGAGRGSDVVGAGALHHQIEPGRFFYIEAKYAEAFTKKALSFSSSPTCLRSRCNSARSAGSKGFSP